MVSVSSRSTDSGIDQTIIIFSRAIDHPFIPLGMPIDHWKRMPLSFQLTVCCGVRLRALTEKCEVSDTIGLTPFNQIPEKRLILYIKLYQ